VCFGATGLVLLALGHWLTPTPTPTPAGFAAGLLMLQAGVMVSPPFLQRLGTMVKTRRWRSSGGQDLGFWITLAISLAGFFGNLIWACFMGVALSCLAVLKRVSGNLTAHWVYLNHYRSRRVRSPGQSDTLTRLKYRVGILRLTGHWFFGNSTRLRQLAQEMPDDAVTVVVHVSQVHDVDPSGSDALVAMVRTLTERRLAVTISGLNTPRAKAPSSLLVLALQDLQGVTHAIDMDRALEGCEYQVLMAATVVAAPLLSDPLDNNHLLHDLSTDEITQVLMLDESREVAKGTPLFYKDTLADGIWLMEEGHVSMLAGGIDATRLATFGPGQFVGEMGLIDGKTRSATARDDSPVRALLLDNRAIAALVTHRPTIAFKITCNIARALSHWVRSTSALLADDSTEQASGWANSALTQSRF